MTAAKEQYLVTVIDPVTGEDTGPPMPFQGDPLTREEIETLRKSIIDSVNAANTEIEDLRKKVNLHAEQNESLRIANNQAIASKQAEIDALVSAHANELAAKREEIRDLAQRNKRLLESALQSETPKRRPPIGMLSSHETVDAAQKPVNFWQRLLDAAVWVWKARR